MKVRRSPVADRRSRRRAGIAALVYVAGGVLWIVAGEWVMTRLLQPTPVSPGLQVVKGLVFVVGTGLLLFLVLLSRERALAVDSAALDLWLRHIPGLAWTTDSQLRLVTVAGTRLPGYEGPLEGLIGKPVWEVGRTEARRRALEAMHRRALAGEATDHRFELPEGTFLVRVERIEGADGSVRGCAGMAVDFTGSPAAGGDEGLRGALRNRQSMASIGALVLAVGHQLKNPLFALSAALDAFELRVPDDPGTVRHRTILREQVERIRSLVSALQEYGQIGEPELRTTDVGTLVERIAADWRGRADRAGVTLRLEAIPAGELVAEVDPEAIAQAVHRLVENALQHTGAEGEILLAAERRRRGPGVELVVEDSGPGFRDEDLHRVTSPLFSRRSGSAGLGLPVAERIAQLHGGHLVLGRSSVGGARVRLVLPA